MIYCENCGGANGAHTAWCRENAKAGPYMDQLARDNTEGRQVAGGGIKFDNGKPPMSLLDRHAMEEIANVLAFGAQKYAAHNWRKGIAYSRLLDAAMRHLFAFADGEDNDPESGLSHVAHAGCCIVFLLGMINARPDMDDRHTEAQ